MDHVAEAPHVHLRPLTFGLQLPDAEAKGWLNGSTTCGSCLKNISDVLINLEGMSLFIYLLCHHSKAEVIEEKSQVMNKEVVMFCWWWKKCQKDFQMFTLSIATVFTGFK